MRTSFLLPGQRFETKEQLAAAHIRVARGFLNSSPEDAMGWKWRMQIAAKSDFNQTVQAAREDLKTHESIDADRAIGSFLIDRAPAIAKNQGKEMAAAVLKEVFEHANSLEGNGPRRRAQLVKRVARELDVTLG